MRARVWDCMRSLFRNFLSLKFSLRLSSLIVRIPNFAFPFFFLPNISIFFNVSETIKNTF